MVNTITDTNEQPKCTGCLEVYVNEVISYPLDSRYNKRTWEILLAFYKSRHGW
jgi:hypothetical protein